MAGLNVHEAPVAGNEAVAPGVGLLVVRGAFAAIPGQFYMVRAWGPYPLLARPFSVFDLDEESLSFVYAVRGEGTRLLQTLSPGEGVNLFGPLGVGWQRAPGRIALVGGGMGLAPLYYAAKAFGSPADTYLGFSGRPFLVGKFAALGHKLFLASETGEGEGVERGLVTEIFDPRGYSACYACGPRAMLGALYKSCHAQGVPLWVSLEERMACGIGACLGCTVLTPHGPKRVCHDGPVFQAEEAFS